MKCDPRTRPEPAPPGIHGSWDDDLWARFSQVFGPMLKDLAEGNRLVVLADSDDLGDVE